MGVLEHGLPATFTSGFAYTCLSHGIASYMDARNKCLEHRTSFGRDGRVLRKEWQAHKPPNLYKEAQPSHFVPEDAVIHCLLRRKSAQRACDQLNSQSSFIKLTSIQTVHYNVVAQNQVTATMPHKANTHPTKQCVPSHTPPIDKCTQVYQKDIGDI